MAAKRTRVAETGLFLTASRAGSTLVRTALPAITHENPLRLAKLLNLKGRDLAERVGFVPAILALINDLGLIGTARNRQNL